MTINWTLIGKRIRNKRLQHNLTQEQLAEFAGTSNIYICRIETGTANPTLEMLMKICKVLNCSISFFIEGGNMVKYDIHAKNISKLLDGCSPYLLRLVNNIVKSMVDIDIS